MTEKKETKNVSMKDFKQYIPNMCLKKEPLAMALKIFKDENSPLYQLLNALYQRLFNGIEPEINNDDVRLVYDMFELYMLDKGQSMLNRMATRNNSDLQRAIKQGVQKPELKETPEPRKFDLNIIPEEQRDFDYLNTHFNREQVIAEYPSAYAFLWTPEFKENHAEHICDEDNVVKWFEGKTA